MITIFLLFFILYGFAKADTITNCTEINSPGVYILQNDIINSTTSICIRINSSNVIFNGNDHVIDGVDNDDTYGIFVNSSQQLTNVTVRNVRLTDWYVGVYYENVTNSTIKKRNSEIE